MSVVRSTVRTPGFRIRGTAAIRAGGNMRLEIGTALVNRYADIQAGAALDVQAAGASVTNQGQTLKRTHRFQITSTTAGGDAFDWTAPDINEVLGHAGGTLSGAQQLSITAQDLSNTDLARSTVHVDDARFSEVAQTIVAAEKAGWKTAEGKPWYPPENGKVPGTDQIIELKVGQRLDRYGGTNDRSTFLAPADTPLGQRALPESTNFAVRDEYIVQKPFKVEESRVMPWFGQEGMGIQYETSKGVEKTIQKLIEDGVLEKVSP